MDATEATMKTSLHTNVTQMVRFTKTLTQMGMPDKSDKTKMMQLANLQATVMNIQGRVTEDLQLLHTLGFYSMDQVKQEQSKITDQLKALTKKDKK